MIDAVKQMTHVLLERWTMHSRTVRVSAVEPWASKTMAKLVKFIKQYGHDLFTPRLLNPGNLRAIRDQGVDEYLRRLKEKPDQDSEFALVAELDFGVSLADAVSHLEAIIDAILENQVEYVDYQMTTTQSDRGELFYSCWTFFASRRTTNGTLTP